MIGPFGSRSGPEDKSRVKGWFRESFGLEGDVSLMVTELRCTEPGCAPVETVIAVLDASGNRRYKVHKPASEISEADIRKLAEGEGV
jgi:hypothetical protein